MLSSSPSKLVAFRVIAVKIYVKIGALFLKSRSCVGCETINVCRESSIHFSCFRRERQAFVNRSNTQLTQLLDYFLPKLNLLGFSDSLQAPLLQVYMYCCNVLFDEPYACDATLQNWWYEPTE